MQDSDVDFKMSWQDSVDSMGCSLNINTSKGICQMEFEVEGCYGFAGEVRVRQLSEVDLLSLQDAVNLSLNNIRKGVI